MKKPTKRRTKGKNAAQLRIQTRDEFTNVFETRPDGDGFSWKMYGPFATADEQRAFMREVCNAAPMTSEEDRISILASIDAWVRFDEEEGYTPPAAEPVESESIIAAPSADEVRLYAPFDGRDDGTVLGADGLSGKQSIRYLIDGLRRYVW
jgi:hypothetical protein